MKCFQELEHNFCRGKITWGKRDKSFGRLGQLMSVRKNACSLVAVKIDVEV